MAFTVGSIAAKDGTPAAIGGGMLAADVAGGGVGPWFLYHGLVDGVAGSNKAAVTAGNALKVDILAAAASIAKAEDVASADGDVGVPAMAIRKASPGNTSGTDGDWEALQISAGRLWTNSLIGDGTNTLTLVQDTAGTNVWAVPVMIHPDSSGIVSTGTAGSPSAAVLSIQGETSMEPVRESGYLVTLTTSITRPADVNQYNANDVWADSTSAPTAGGFTLTGAGRISGGSGVITDIVISSSAVPGTLLQGELHIFDQAVTAMNDNAAWSLSDSDALNRIAIVPFTMLADANNSFCHVQNLNISYTCVGAANLRYIPKVKNAYTPASAEVLTVKAKAIQVT